MAKVAFSKLGLKVNSDTKTIVFNEQNIEVLQYLPVNDMLSLIADVVNLSADENNFANPVKVNVFTTIGIIEYYTNITFTDKQKENITKLYDMIISGGLYEKIIEAIPHEEIIGLFDAIKETIESIYKYRNSVLGILETVKTDYDTTQFDLTALKDEISNMDNMQVLQDIITKLG